MRYILLKAFIVTAVCGALSEPIVKITFSHTVLPLQRAFMLLGVEEGEAGLYALGCISLSLCLAVFVTAALAFSCLHIFRRT